MKVKIEFTEQELNIILYSLQKQPFEMVNELLNNLVKQVKEQQSTEESKKE